MKKAIVDLDDVLALNAFLNILNDFNHSSYTYDDVQGYYVDELLEKEKQIEFRKYMKTKNLYDYASVAPYSKEVLMNIMLEYEVYITSSCYSDIDRKLYTYLIDQKYEFIRKNYPFLDPKNFIFITDKSMLNADLRIDDKLSNLSNIGINYLFSAYHNLNISDAKLKEKNIIRTNNWLEIENELNKQKVFTNK